MYYTTNTLFLGVALLCYCAPTTAYSPWFTSTWRVMQDSFEKFTGCSSLEPTAVNGSTEMYLVEQINKFFDVAAYSQENINATITFLNKMCQPNTDYAVIGDINVTTLSINKQARCQTLENTMNVLYREFKRSAVNQSIVLDLENVDYERDINGSGYHKNIMSHINAAWIKSNYSVDNVCYMTNQIIDHLRYINPVTRRLDNSSEGVVGTLKYYLDPILSLWTRLYLYITNEAAQARNTASYGYHSTTDWFKRGFSRLTGYPAQEQQVAALVVPTNITVAPSP